MENSDFRPCLPKKLYDQIEEDVVKLYLELELSVPIKPSRVAERLGYIVKKYSESEFDEQQLTELRTGKDGSRRDGLSHYDPNKKTYVIWVNDIDSINVEREEFTIMHEIGHIRRGHKTDSQLAEMEANYYAAYALVPSPLPRIHNWSSFLDIIDIFEVSQDCAFYSARRCMNWENYSGKIKKYEQELITYYRKRLADDGN